MTVARLRELLAQQDPEEKVHLMVFEVESPMGRGLAGVLYVGQWDQFREVRKAVGTLTPLVGTPTPTHTRPVRLFIPAPPKPQPTEFVEVT